MGLHGLDGVTELYLTDCSVNSHISRRLSNASWIMELAGNQYYYNLALKHLNTLEAKNGISYPYQDPEVFYTYPFEFESTHSDESFNSLSIQGLVERSISTEKEITDMEH